MGVLVYLVNTSKKERICLGKYGEEDPISVLRNAIRLIGWSFEDDLRTIDEYCDDLSCVLAETAAQDYSYEKDEFRRR